ncbi:MAG: hypothetical protein AAF531_26350, partial [Actinomycetota bacterium]
ISAIRVNSLTGSIEVAGGDRLLTCTVPDRERLEKMAQAPAKVREARNRPQVEDMATPAEGQP